MTVALPVFFVGLGIALTLAAPPGPMNALIAREAARHGAWHGVRAGLAAPVFDAAALVLVLWGIDAVGVVGPVLPWLSLVGAAVVFLFAWQTARLGTAAGPAAARPVALWQSATMAVTNPLAYVWWLSAGVALFAHIGWAGGIGFVTGIFGWVVAYSAVVAHGASRWTWFEPAVTLASADLLLVFAILLGHFGAAGL